MPNSRTILNGQMARQKKVTDRLQPRAAGPINQTSTFNAGRGALMDTLRDIQRRQSQRTSALGAGGSELEVANASGRGQVAAQGIRGLTADAAGAQRADTALLMQSLNAENGLAGLGIQLDEAKKQRILQALTSAIGAGVQAASGGK